jgi:hypothetical protein
MPYWDRNVPLRAVRASFMSEFGIAVGIAKPVCDAGNRHHPAPCGGINPNTHPAQSPVRSRQISVLVSSTLDKAKALYRQKINATVAVRSIRIAEK